jgi:hypothetical protein
MHIVIGFHGQSFSKLVEQCSKYIYIKMYEKMPLVSQSRYYPSMLY